MKLHFEASGQGDPLIILHGLLGSLENWHNVSKEFARHFRVFALDQRNHGRSPHSFEMDYAVMAQDIRDFLQEHALQQAYILGHSMGGKTAMEVALLYPEIVAKLIVVDIAPRSYPPWHQKTIEGMLTLDLSWFKSRKEIEAALAPAVPEVPARQFLLKNLAQDSSRRFYWKIGLREIRQNYLRLTEALSSNTPFEKITLFVRGERSDFLLPSDLDNIRPLFPKAILKEIAGAGHLVHVANPPVFFATVLEFLRDT